MVRPSLQFVLRMRHTEDLPWAKLTLAGVTGGPRERADSRSGSFGEWCRFAAAGLRPRSFQDLAQLCYIPENLGAPANIHPCLGRWRVKSAPIDPRCPARNMLPIFPGLRLRIWSYLLRLVRRRCSIGPRTFGSTPQVFWTLAIPVIQSLKSSLPYISRC